MEIVLLLSCFCCILCHFGIVSRDSDSHNKLDTNNAEWIYITGGDIVEGSSEIQRVTPGPRSRAAGWGSSEGNFWMFGGLGHDTSDSKTAHITNDLWMFNLTAMAWQNIQQPCLDGRRVYQQPPARRGAVACGVESIIFVVFGGEGLETKMLNDTWVFDIDRETWFPLTNNGPHGSPPGRVSPIVWCLDNALIIYGGQQGDNLLNDMWQLSLANLSWNKLASSTELNPGTRIGSTTWIHADDLLLFGGSATTKSNPGPVRLHSDMWKFSLISKDWTLLSKGKIVDDTRMGLLSERASSSDPKPRKFSQGWCSKERPLLYMYGGEGHSRYSITNEQSQLFETLWQYNLDERTWTQIPFYTARMRSSRGVSQVPGRSRGNSWIGRQGEFYTFGGLTHNPAGKVSQTNDIWSLIPPSTAIPDQFKDRSLEIIQYPTMGKKSIQSAGFIFLMVLLTFGGVVMLVGAVFCMKKMTDYPRHNPTDKFRVRYSKLDKDGDPEDEAEEFLLHNDDDDVEDAKASFRILKR